MNFLLKRTKSGSLRSVDYLESCMPQHFQSKATPSTTPLGRLPFSRSHKLSCEIIAIPLYIPVVAHHQIHYQNVYLRDASSKIVQREFSPHRIYSSIYTCATIQKKRSCHNKCFFLFLFVFFSLHTKKNIPRMICRKYS